MVEEPKVGITERVKGFIKSKPILPSDKVDKYITGNFPELVSEYKLATSKDLNGVDKKIEKFVEEIDEMREWKINTEERVEVYHKKIARLEKRYGLKGG
ncbi:MAG: hypothetical protein R6U61_08365 [Thermoplasmata archaeon]